MGHHVLLQALAKPHTSIEAGRDDVDQGIVADHLQPHLRMTGEEALHQRRQHPLHGSLRCIQAQGTRWAGAVLVQLIERDGDVVECRSQPLQQLLAGLGR
ncbi:MAG: hypothetical protein RL223_4881 [Pseudomonadota bacterium]